MNITDAPQDRFSLGIERFIAGHLITCHSVNFYKRTPSTLQVDSFTEWPPEQTTESHVMSQIARSKAVLEDLMKKSAVFRDAAGQLKHDFACCYDYGMGSITLGNEINGRFQWVSSRES